MPLLRDLELAFGPTAGNDTALAIGRFVEGRGDRLRSLILTLSCRVSDVGCAHLTRALAHTTQLRTLRLHLANNLITNHGVFALTKVVAAGCGRVLRDFQLDLLYNCTDDGAMMMLMTAIMGWKELRRLHLGSGQVDRVVALYTTVCD